MTVVGHDQKKKNLKIKKKGGWERTRWWEFTVLSEKSDFASRTHCLLPQDRWDNEFITPLSLLT